MTELETLQRAKMYIDKLANGTNPLDNTALSENDIVNNVRISRCLFYVSDVLRKVIENNGNIGSQKRVKKTDFIITEDELKNFDYSSKPIPVSEIAKRINDITDTENCKKFTHRMVTQWLVEIGMLLETVNEKDEKCKRPTQQGAELGIFVEERMGERGPYKVVVYNTSAQSFIIDNIYCILEHHYQKN